ncbi:tail fiber domain-containing protein [Hymenobacter chitinivorans]|uniref:tail fiber domain-containing protein n=1 Tax=Hymenobacter chitinivorans TaxID=89969 RepID=UPI000C234AA0|nr:tail fiber domain-containing protein [Hymenobacter chitinivorans]
MAADEATTNFLNSSANNQFSTRYVGGYRLYTNSAMSVGVQLFAGGNAWQTLSDSTKKERRVLADGNQFLARINQMRLGSWNYIGQSPDTMRHYGPMAQDFYRAFGHDGVGRSGNATTINQADFDGVNLIAIQALYRRVLALEAENAKLRQQQARARQPEQPGTAAATTAALEERVRRLEALLVAQAQR